MSDEIEALRAALAEARGLLQDIYSELSVGPEMSDGLADRLRAFLAARPAPAECEDCNEPSCKSPLHPHAPRADPRPAPACACLDGVITGMLEHAPKCPRADPRPAPRRYHPDCIHPESTDCYLCRAEPPAPRCDCFDLADPATDRRRWKHLPDCPAAAKRGGGQ